MAGNDDSMTKASRERKILRFLDEREVMLGPKALYDNLVEYEGITFSSKTVKRLLIDMNERGLVDRKDIGRGYYQITDEGREYLYEDIGDDA